MKLETHLWAENVLIMVGTHFYLVADHSVGVGGRLDPCGSVLTDHLMHRAEVQRCRGTEVQ